MLGEAYFQWVSPPPLQWAKPERSQFWSSLLFMRTLFDTNRPNLTCWEKHISSGSARPHCNGRTPSVPQFWSSLLFVRTFFDTKRPNLTCGEKHISSGSAHPYCKGRSSSLPQFRSSLLLMCTFFDTEEQKFDVVTHCRLRDIDFRNYNFGTSLKLLT